MAALLRGGVSPSAQGSSGMFDTWSLLHIAAWHGQAGHADLLLGMRADVSATNRKGDTALRLAAHKGQLAVARLLVQAQANPTTTNISGLNALQSAASTDSASSVELCALLEQVTRDRRLEQLVGGVLLFESSVSNTPCHTAPHRPTPSNPAPHRPTPPNQTT